LHVLLTAIGSHGDVHPILGLGVRLRRRGHQVTILAIEVFADLVRQSGLEMISILPTAEFERMNSDPNLWRPFRGPLKILRQCSAQLVRPVYETIAAHYVPGETVVGAHSLDFSSRLAQEKLGVPLASIHLAPFVFPSVEAMPVALRSMRSLPGPRWLKRFAYWSADRFLLDPILDESVGALRRELGLPRVQRYVQRWNFSPQRVIGLFPDWFGPMQTDWPPQTVLTGFPLWDESELGSGSDELNEFLAGGDPPIVFTPGSAMKFGEPFFAAAVVACQRLGRRAVLLTRHRESLPRDLPDGIRHFDFEPLSRLLPRAAAMVHHGGIGTTAQALAAGLPQVIMPMAFDQPDNAVRLKRLGVAEAIRPERFRADRLAAALERLLTSDAVAANCRRWAERCDGDQAIDRACDELEKLAGTDRP